MAEEVFVLETNITEAINRQEGTDQKGQKWIRYSIKVDDPDWNEIEFGYFYRPAVSEMIEPAEGGPVKIHFTEKEYQGQPQYHIRKIEDPRGAKPKPKPKPKTQAAGPTGEAQPQHSIAQYGRFQAMIDLVGMRSRLLSELEDLPAPQDAAADCVIFALSVLEYIKDPQKLKATPPKTAPADPPTGGGYAGDGPDDDIPF